MTTEALEKYKADLAKGDIMAHGRWSDEARWRSVAREIAMDIFELPVILKNHGVSDDEWQQMTGSRGFNAMVTQEIATWNSSLNVRERIEARTLAMMEGSLQELYRALHDPEFAHSAKVELFKALSRNVGIGVKEAQVGQVGERMSITINMGDDRKLELQDVTPKGNVIEEKAVEFSISE